MVLSCGTGTMARMLGVSPTIISAEVQIPVLGKPHGDIVRKDAGDGVTDNSIRTAHADRYAISIPWEDELILVWERLEAGTLADGKATLWQTKGKLVCMPSTILRAKATELYVSMMF